MPGLVFDIKRYAIHDGPGIRTTVFLKGCPLRCWWCHNPESQEAEIQQAVKVRKLDGRVFEEEESIGRWMTVEEVMDEVKRDAVYYEESSGGVTLSGGEPLMQGEFSESLLKALKEEGFHTCIDTSGHTEPAMLKKSMPYTDLYLYDIKLIDDVGHLNYTGVSNELAFSNLKLLVRNGKHIIARFPVIPGITDGPGNLEGIMALLHHHGLERIDLLPYHAIARSKYQRLGLTYRMPEVREPSAAWLDELKTAFEREGFMAEIG